MLAIVVTLAACLAVGHCVSYKIQETTVDGIMNTCLDGTNHKSQPGPESELFNHCSPWAKRSCCTAETSQGISFDKAWLNFDWNHCQTLSPKCSQHFIKDLCFYECSPNVGPYLVPDVRKIRKEKFVNVPMCQKTCDRWWDDCKDDFTCLDNWSSNFNWSTGINKCPAGAECKKFEVMFKSATYFCENVWGHSFKVVPDTQDCFRLWFSPDENPNEAVARKEARRKLGLAGSADRVVATFAAPVYVMLLLLSFVGE